MPARGARPTTFIAEGRVTVNGVPAALGTQVDDGDDVRLDGDRVGAARKKSRPVYIALNKPVGITCTTERHVAGNIVDFVDHPERVFPIGRLDKDSEGLILLTNDGDIVNEVLRAEHNHEKEYVVAVDRAITPEFVAQHGRAACGSPTRRRSACKVTQARPEGVRHRADPGPQPADPAHVRGARLHRRGAAARAHHAHPARPAAARALAQAVAAGDRAAAAEVGPAGAAATAEAGLGVCRPTTP